MTMTKRGGLTAALAAALFGAAACSAPADPTAGDDALRRDLDAATSVGLAPAARTQFVSALELGRTADGPAEAPPARARRRAPERALARPVARTVARSAAPRAEVRRAAPRATTRASAPVVVAAAPVEAPRVEPAEVVAPAPRPEPIVAAPSRRSMPAAESGRRSGGWSTADVIRNAPFPINP
jgi:hypothetical protein